VGLHAREVSVSASQQDIHVVAAVQINTYKTYTVLTNNKVKSSLSSILFVGAEMRVVMRASQHEDLLTQK
jgi:hypothetical protein